MLKVTAIFKTVILCILFSSLNAQAVSYSDSPDSSKHFGPKKNHKRNSDCQAPGRPSDFLPFGAEDHFRLSTGKQNLWFCLIIPKTSIRVSYKTDKLTSAPRITLYKMANFERIDWIESGWSRSSQDGFVLFGGKKKYDHALSPGYYFLSIELQPHKRTTITIVTE